MNKIILLGNMTYEPETQTTKNGSSITKFGLAVQRRGVAEGKQDVDFFNAIAFGKLGEFICKYFHKGSRILIEGRMEISRYTNREGKDVISPQVVADGAYFAESASASRARMAESAPGGEYQAPESNYPQGQFNTVDAVDDAELPFN